VWQNVRGESEASENGKKNGCWEVITRNKKTGGRINDILEK
jgi:hypothetical protein